MIDRRPYVYFARDAECDVIKIGFTESHPISRLLTGTLAFNPHEVLLIGAFEADRKTERDLHVRFAHLRTRREWFSTAPELTELIGERSLPASVLLSRYHIVRQDHAVTIRSLLREMPGFSAVDGLLRQKAAPTFSVRAPSARKQTT